MAHRTIQLQNDRRPSTRNLLPNWAFTLERVMGIEPRTVSWEVTAGARRSPAGTLTWGKTALRLKP
jgi:hypothetical protein